MSNSVRTRASSEPVRHFDTAKQKIQRISKEDLEIFINQYKKKSILSKFRGLPPEIAIMECIVKQTETSRFQKSPISEINKEIFFHVLSMNKEFRDANPKKEPRLRDKVIDSMMSYLGITATYFCFEEIF